MAYKQSAKLTPPVIMTQPHDIVLYRTLMQCPLLWAAGGDVAKGQPYGVLVLLGERPLGLWSYRGPSYIFRDLAHYGTALEAETLDCARVLTIALIEACSQGWAERFGPVHRHACVA